MQRKNVRKSIIYHGIKKITNKIEKKIAKNKTNKKNKQRTNDE